MQLCTYAPAYPRDAGFSFRVGGYIDTTVSQWYQWHGIAFFDELPNTTTLANDIASLSTRVQALEARINSLETNQ